MKVGRFCRNIHHGRFGTFQNQFKDKPCHQQWHKYIERPATTAGGINKRDSLTQNQGSNIRRGGIRDEMDHLVVLIADFIKLI